jgi:predicted AlkP superfamily phosphohydrolase/phosphomutase
VEHAGAIEDLYVRMDGLLARTMEHVDDNTLLLVISDHGFKQFKRGVNLNTWFLENGYMASRVDTGGPGAAAATGAAGDPGSTAEPAAAGGDGAHQDETCSLGGYCTGSDGTTSVIGEYLENVDWSRTKAYQLGLSGIYLNRKGRESQGVLSKDEYLAVKREIKEKLEGMKDPETGETAITSVYDTTAMMNGPYAANAPDLLIGYNVGYRASWDGAVGKSSAAVVEDNVKSWSGDHCIDYKLVPGVIFSNRKVEVERPGLIDVGPSILELFGVKVPAYMQGRSIFRRDASRTAVGGDGGGADAA